MKNWNMALAAVALLATPASAQDLRTQLGTCLAIPGVLQRLSCYDGVAKGMAPSAAMARAAAPAPVQQAYRPAPPPVQLGSERLPPPPPVRSASAVQGFGEERLQKNIEAPKSGGFTAAITDLKFTPNGKFVVTLNNGQVWRQIDGDSTTLVYRKSYKTVTVSRGLIASYNLVFNHTGSYYKVTRLQ